MENVYQKLKNIRCIIMDVDGVLTDNTIICAENGEMLRVMNVLDGYAIKVLLEQDFYLCVITGGGSVGVIRRLNHLGIRDIYDKTFNKLEVLKEYLQKNDILPEQVAYIGDDIPDISGMLHCGVRFCPADARPEVRAIAHYICKNKGGKGCVREIAEMILKLQNKWAVPTLNQ